jgi:hypothetical protein
MHGACRASPYVREARVWTSARLAIAVDDTRWSALAPNSRLPSAEEQACLHTTGALRIGIATALGP